jgi:hypothetical protein
MKKFDPIIEKFKDVFLDGNDEDPACGGAKPARGRGRGIRGGSTTANGAGRGKATANNSQNTQS